MSEIIGPNVKRLLIHKMSIGAIPEGGGVADGIKFLSNRDDLIKSAREAHNWVKNMIFVLKNASDPNPYKDFTDEEIAEKILNSIKEKQALKRKE